MSNITQKTTTEKLLQTCIEDLVIEIGWYRSLWKHTFSQYSNYTSDHSLIFHTCEYNAPHAIHIEVPHHEIYPKREGDKAIMDLATKYYTDTSKLRSIQKVRMELGVVHVSDLCSADGRRLDNRFFSSKLKSVVCNTDSWPVKHRVNKKYYTHWRNLLNKIFNGENSILITPLMNWLKCDQQRWITEWDFFQSESRKFLYRQYIKGVWRRHLRIPHY